MKGIDIFGLAVCAAIGWNLGNAAWIIFLEYLSRLEKVIIRKRPSKEQSKKWIYTNYNDEKKYFIKRGDPDER